MLIIIRKIGPQVIDCNICSPTAHTAYYQTTDIIIGVWTSVHLHTFK